jgi:hypothetical protein
MITSSQFFKKTFFQSEEIEEVKENEHLSPWKNANITKNNSKIFEKRSNHLERYADLSMEIMGKQKKHKRS